MGSHVVQLVGCWIHTPKVVGSTPISASCFMRDNILGQDANLDCASLYPGILASAPCMAAIDKVTKVSYACWGNTM